MDNNTMEQMAEAMTNHELNTILDAVGKTAEENEDISHLREIQNSEVSDENTGLVEKTETFEIKEDGTPNLIMPVNESVTDEESNKDLQEAVNDINLEKDKNFTESFKENMNTMYGVSDDDAIKILDAVVAYKKDKNTNVYSLMPESVKNQINQLMVANNIPITKRAALTRDLMTQFISEAAQDKTFVDFEEAIDKAMRIPSLTDLYNEHLSETMDKKLPAMAAAIEETDPAKAAMLRSIAVRFEMSMTYSLMIDMYEKNTRLRKFVRKNYMDEKKFAEEVNYMNQDNEFKMPDATTLHNIIKNTIIKNDTDLNEVDVQKFLTLLLKSISYITDNAVDPIVKNAYNYYILKNIVMAGYADEKTKTNFSAELINNIMTVMYYIRAREVEFENANVSSKSNSGHKLKRSQRKRH